MTDIENAMVGDSLIPEWNPSRILFSPPEVAKPSIKFSWSLENLNPPAQISAYHFLWLAAVAINEQGTGVQQCCPCSQR
jgi:hypothetical protein